MRTIILFLLDSTVYRILDFIVYRTLCYKLPNYNVRVPGPFWSTQTLVHWTPGHSQHVTTWVRFSFQNPVTWVVFFRQTRLFWTKAGLRFIESCVVRWLAVEEQYSYSWTRRMRLTFSVSGIRYQLACFFRRARVSACGGRKGVFRFFRRYPAERSVDTGFVSYSIQWTHDDDDDDDDDNVHSV